MKKLLLTIAVAFIGIKGLAQAPTNGLVAYFNFQNTFGSNNPSHSFAVNSFSGGNPTFTTGKYGQGVSFTSGQSVVNNSMDAAIPQGNYANAIAGDYTICFWLKKTTTSRTFETAVEMFASHYFRVESNNYTTGMATAATTFYGNNVGSSPTINTWKHYIIVYSGSGTLAQPRITVYEDGVATSSVISMPVATVMHRFTNKITVGGGTDTIGTTVLSKALEGSIDELYFYNRVLSSTERANVRNATNGILSTQDFNSKNLKATIYPNPASNNFTIQIENEIKSVEIYSLQGQKVLTSNAKNVNVSSLSKGMYLVRIEDENNAVATQKLVIE